MSEQNASRRRCRFDCTPNVSQMFEELIVARKMTALPLGFAVAILVVGQHITAEREQLLCRLLIALGVFAEAMHDEDLSFRL